MRETDTRQSPLHSKCANGETILLTLDTTIPRAYYSRNFSVRGTKAMSSEERKVVFMEGMEEEIANNEDEMYAKYDHPLHTEAKSHFFHLLSSRTAADYEI